MAPLDLVLKPKYTYEGFSIFGIAGGSIATIIEDGRVSVSGVGSASTIDSSVEFGFVFGGGVSFDLEGFGINAEVTYASLGDYDLSPRYSVGLKFIY